MTNGERGYAELHCHTNFSFLDGASHPEELADEAARLGLAALAVTDHDGLYGVVRFALAARATGLPTVFGAELTLDAPRTPPNGYADPPGEHLVVLADGPGRVRPPGPGGERGAAGGGEGRAPPRSRRARRRRPRGSSPAPLRGERERRVVRAHRVPQGRGHARAPRRRPGRSPARPRPARRRLRTRPRARRALGPRRPARPAPQRRAGRGGGVGVRRRDRHQQRALRHARSAAARDRARRRPCPALARRDRRLVAGGAVRAPAQRGRAATPVRRAGPARSSARSTSRRRARSTSASPRPSCPTTTCRPVTPR